MGLFDKIKRDFPFSWSGDYTEYYKEQSALKEPEEPPEKEKPVSVPADYSQEPETFRRHRIKLQAYSKKLTEREKRIKREERSALARIEKAQADSKLYSQALYETEYRIMDYAKRIDQKERTLFEEIRENVDKFNKYNSGPSENGFQFEEDFSNVLMRNGFINVTVTQRSNDYGADITAEKDGITYVIQCKYYSSAVGIEAVQQVYAAKIHYGTHVAVVATNSVFTQAAKVLAKETGVLLWDCEKVSQMQETN